MPHAALVSLFGKSANESCIFWLLDVESEDATCHKITQHGSHEEPTAHQGIGYGFSVSVHKSPPKSTGTCHTAHKHKIQDTHKSPEKVGEETHHPPGLHNHVCAIE